MGHKLKENVFIDVNGRLESTWLVTLYKNRMDLFQQSLCQSVILHVDVAKRSFDETFLILSASLHGNAIGEERSLHVSQQVWEDRLFWGAFVELDERTE